VIEHGNLETSRDVSDVSVSSEIVVKLAENGIPGEAYNIGSGKAVKTSELLKIALSWSSKSIVTKSSASRFRAYDEKVLLADLSKLKRLFDWEPKQDLKSAIQLILNYWRSRVQRSLSSALVPLKSTSSIQKTCPMSNIDIFLVTCYRDFPLTQYVLRSIDIFMQCRGKIHVFVDKTDFVHLQSYFDISNPSYSFHELTLPSELGHLPGYISQAYLMMVADQFVDSNPDFIMFLDTDSPLGLPVTCRSLFDSKGRPWLAGWDIRLRQPQFIKGITDLVNPPKFRSSYMSYFPFLIAKKSLPRMRSHIMKTLNVDQRKHSFHEAFSRWSKKSDVKVMEFSQFAVMGSYLETFEEHMVHPIYCPQNDDSAGNESCKKYIPVAAHLGWRYCHYVGSCVEGSIDKFRSSGNEFTKFSRKYGQITVNAIEEIISAGVCLKQYIQEGQISPGCTDATMKHVHPEMLPYPKNQPSEEWIRHVFSESSSECKLAADLSRI
jgi:hypothetical protein